MNPWDKFNRIMLRTMLKARVADAFEESDHPRAENGQFTSKGEGSTGGKAEQIAALKEQLRKTSLFGAGAKKRVELQRMIKELEGDKPQESKPVVKRQPKPEPIKVEAKGFPVTAQKEAQFDIIQKTNAMGDDYHTGIRKPSDIRSPEEAFNPSDDEGYSYPDFTREDGEKALKTGKITVYSSKPIKNGGFISPSRRMAGDYAGGGKVYSAEVPIGAVAWINADEGQMANIGTTDSVHDSFNKIMLRAMLTHRVKHGIIDADWDETRHPRGKGGRFAKKGETPSGSQKYSPKEPSPRTMANGLRAPKTKLTPEQIEEVKGYIAAIDADPSVFNYDKPHIGTCYIEEDDIVYVSGNVFPDLSSAKARDRMSPMAVLAHEYYGHRAFKPSEYEIDDWRDEYRASYTAAIKAPGLSDEDRQLLMRDALDRAAEAGANIEIDAEMRRILYGY